MNRRILEKQGNLDDDSQLTLSPSLGNKIRNGGSWWIWGQIAEMIMMGLGGGHAGLVLPDPPIFQEKPEIYLTEKYIFKICIGQEKLFLQTICLWPQIYLLPLQWTHGDAHFKSSFSFTSLPTPQLYLVPNRHLGNLYLPQIPFSWGSCSMSIFFLSPPYMYPEFPLAFLRVSAEYPLCSPWGAKAIPGTLHRS